jgi:nuclease S1
MRDEHWSRRLAARRARVPLAVGIAWLAAVPLLAWGPQGHRLVADVAARHLTKIARENVAWLLDDASLASVASWADDIRADNAQTGFWHYVNIPRGAAGYDRGRDCPPQPGVAPGSRNDRWRDCVVDRIPYFEDRLGETKLDRADRATALKFLVHFVADIHQPMHATAVARGANDIPVTVFGSSNCNRNPNAPPYPCNLHSVWDSLLIEHRNLDDRGYEAALEALIAREHLEARGGGTPAEWADESQKLAEAALVAPDTDIDEAYYRREIAVVDRRLALGGVRLAAVLDRILKAPPPR